MDSVDKTQSIGKQQASLLGARIKSMITLLLLPLPCVSSSNDQGGSLQPALPGVTLFQTKLGACKDPEASEKLRTSQSERARKAVAVYQSPPGTRCSSGLSSPSSSSSWASSCSTANSSAEVLASKADTASCRTETVRQLTPDSPTAMQKLLGCRLTLPAVKTQLVPDPVLLLRTSMKAEHNEIKNKHKLPDVRKREDLTGAVGAGGLRSRRKQRYKRGDHHCQSKGICQPRREAHGLEMGCLDSGPHGPLHKKTAKECRTTKSVHTVWLGQTSPRCV